MASNVAVAQDPAGNLKPAKNKSTERIDGIFAAIMAIGRHMLAQEEWETRPMVVWVRARPRNRAADALTWVARERLAAS